VERAFGRLKSTAGFTQMRAPESQSAACPLWTSCDSPGAGLGDYCFAIRKQPSRERPARRVLLVRSGRLVRAPGAVAFGGKAGVAAQHVVTTGRGGGISRSPRGAFGDTIRCDGNARDPTVRQ
jgi:hypothetical protein